MSEVIKGGCPPILGSGGGGSGEVNTASNLGAGEGVFANKASSDLRFKSLVAGSGITLTSSASEITIDSSGGSGEVNTGNNAGSGAAIFRDKTGTILNFRSLVSSDGSLNITQNADEVNIIREAATQDGVIEMWRSSTSDWERVAIVSGILRNPSGTGWVVLDDADHSPINVSSVSNTTTVIQANFPFTTSDIYTINVDPDETLNTYQWGTKVATTFVQISARYFEMRSVQGYLTYRTATSDWAWTTLAGGLSATISGSNTVNQVQITHADCNFNLPQLITTSTTFLPFISTSISGTTTTINIRDWSGATGASIPDGTRLFVQRRSYTTTDQRVIDPNLISGGTANVWMFGFVKPL